MNKLSGVLLVLSAALTFIVVLAVADTVSAMAASTGNVNHSTANGQRIFAQFCASRHDAPSITSRVGIGLQFCSVRTILKRKGAMPGFSILLNCRLTISSNISEPSRSWSPDIQSAV
jgi:hypothetical protein